MNTEVKPVQELAFNKIAFGNALITNVEFENGKQTQIITIFNNNEFNFEEIKIGLDYSLKRIHKDYDRIKSVQTTFNNIKDAILKPFAKYQKQEFTNSK